jgi:hypothetical protein
VKFSKLIVRESRRYVITVAIFFCLAAVACFAQAGKIEPLDATTDPAVPQALRSALAPKGYRVTPDANTPPIEIWYRKEVPAAAKKAADDAVYERLTPGTLMGVLHFPRAASDYRGQSIAAGFYALRYALMPNDGNHLGVAPSRDFLLLIPVAADPGPDAVPQFEDEVALSRRASGSKHPAPMSLVPAEAGAAPALSKDDEGHVIFTTGVHMAAGEDMRIALVVKGTAPQ